jgi:hypothetical protein
LRQIACFPRDDSPEAINGLGIDTGKRLAAREKRLIAQENSTKTVSRIGVRDIVASHCCARYAGSEQWVGDGGSAIGAFNPYRSFEEPLQLFGRNRVLAPGLPGRNIAGRREALQ